MKFQAFGEVFNFYFHLHDVGPGSLQSPHLLLEVLDVFETVEVDCAAFAAEIESEDHSGPML